MDSFGGEDLDCDSHLTACDYIRYRIEQESNLSWFDCPFLPEPNDCHQMMRKLCTKFEAGHAEELKKIAAQISVEPNIAYPNFVRVSKPIFYNGIDWEKIVTLYTLGGILALKCINDGWPKRISDIADWIGVFVDAHLDMWIQTRGGWSDILKYANSVNE